MENRPKGILTASEFMEKLNWLVSETHNSTDITFHTLKAKQDVRDVARTMLFTLQTMPIKVKKREENFEQSELPL